jgi:hypothetical protein
MLHTSLIMKTMWPFKRKKADQRNPPRKNTACSHCGSENTAIAAYSGAAEPDYIKVWRGQRYVKSRCFDCGRTFYSEECKDGSPLDFDPGEEETVYDEEALRAAEEEVKRQAEEDRRYPGW